MKAIFRIEYAIRQFMSMDFRRFVEYHDRIETARMIRSINKRQSAFLISVTCHLINEDSLNVTPIAKSINRHQLKEIKRLTVIYKRETRESKARVKELNQWLTHYKSIEWRDRLASGFDIQLNQSSVKDMTSEEKKEWADKFFSAL